MARNLVEEMKVLDVGGKNGLNARAYFPDAEIRVVDKSMGWDVMKMGLPDGVWDIIFASHFIEHIVDPDYFLDECKKVMIPDTTLEIDTPNLGAWFNRILLLFGYQPHFTEVSTRYDVGKLRLGTEEKPGGHLHLFTLRALKELLTIHGFKIHSIQGKPLEYPLPLLLKLLDRLFSKIPSLASELRVKCGYLG